MGPVRSVGSSKCHNVWLPNLTAGNGLKKAVRTLRAAAAACRFRHHQLIGPKATMPCTAYWFVTVMRHHSHFLT